MDDSNLSAALTSDSEDTGGGGGLSAAVAPPSTPEPTSNAPVDNTLVPPADNLTGVQPMIQAAGQATAQDMPRMSRLKASLAGFLLSGIPGAVAGAIEPKMIQSEVAGRKQIQQADITFKNAQAAHEVAMAHQADLEYQALPGKLQDEASARGLANITAARQAGYLPVADIPLDQGASQNSANAMTALNSVKSQFGAVPSGLLYIHTGNGMTVMRLQDPNAALDTINKARRAQGQSPIDADVFSTLKPEDRDNMARDAINFTDPRDVNGMVTQNSLNLANMRLETVKSQPDFNGKDALVTQLQNTVDHQKQVLDSGAGAEAIRAGQAKGAEAQAAQPGTTAAQVANINATAGPEAKAAGMKATAEENAKLPGEIALKKMEQSDNPVFAVNPKTGQRELTTQGDAKASGFTNPIKASQGDVEKETQLNAQMNELQLNTSRFKNALNAMGTLSKADAASISHILSDPNVNNLILNNAGLPAVMSMIEQGGKASDWNRLSPDKQDAVMGALRMKNSALLFQKVATGMGRASKEAMDIEIANMPSPLEGATVGNKKLEAFQENIDQMAARSVKLPWMDQPQDVKKRVEDQGVAAFNAREAAKPVKPQGQFTAKTPVKVGQNVQVPHAAGLSRVKKVYEDGSFDADQKP